MPSLPQVTLQPRKARPFFGRHPWVLDSAIASTSGPVADGEAVDLLSERGEWIARGIYNSHSRLRVRLYSWNPEEQLDRDFWQRRIDQALALRQALGRGTSDALRLISSEGDRLSGLVVERYGEYLVVQVTSLGIAQRLTELLPLLAERLTAQGTQVRGMVVRSVREFNKSEGLTLVDGPAWGEVPDELIFFEEHGLRYATDLRAGQKTGFYLDQRDNRLAVAHYMPRRRVLDVCCYSGSFALAAAKLGGAREVVGIDSSSHAIELAQAHAQRNEVANVRFERADAFEFLDAQASAGEQFDAVILDPPSFARSRSAVPEALRAYHHLNRRAVELLPSGGILVSCCCSGQVSREEYRQMLSDVAQRSGRDIQILETRGAAADHPVLASCPETDYLQCIVCRVC